MADQWTCILCGEPLGTPLSVEPHVCGQAARNAHIRRLLVQLFLEVVRKRGFGDKAPHPARTGR